MTNQWKAPILYIDFYLKIISCSLGFYPKSQAAAANQEVAKDDSTKEADKVRKAGPCVDRVKHYQDRLDWCSPHWSATPTRSNHSFLTFWPHSLARLFRCHMYPCPLIGSSSATADVPLKYIKIISIIPFLHLLFHFTWHFSQIIGWWGLGSKNKRKQVEVL